MSNIKCINCEYWDAEECPMCHIEWYYDEDDGSDWVLVNQAEEDGYCHRFKEYKYEQD